MRRSIVGQLFTVHVFSFRSVWGLQSTVVFVHRRGEVRLMMELR
jgi:regulator of RNase E activity RraA